MKAFYLIKRKDKLTQGKPTIYCRFRAADGSLLPWRSTGFNSRGGAEGWAVAELKAGRAEVRRRATFEGYAGDWWTADHAYVQGRLARGHRLTATYLVVMRGHLVNHLLPHFKDKRLDAITPRHIEEWLLTLRKAKLSPSTINHALRCLKVILREACREGAIPRDPAAFITGLAEHPAERGVLTGQEVRLLFDERTFAKVWAGDRKHFVLNMTAASTGCRMGELQALPVGAVHENYLDVSQSWERREGLKPGTKTGPGRLVPLPSITAGHLRALVAASPNQQPTDLVFWGRDRGTPLTPRAILDGLYSALAAIKITAEEREERRITFHSWRHFLNTALRAARVPDPLVQRVTGHATQEMTEHYSHFAVEDFGSVVRIQEGLFQPLTTVVVKRQNTGRRG